MVGLGKKADAILAVRAGLDACSWGDVVLLQELKQVESQCEEKQKSSTDSLASLQHEQVPAKGRRRRRKRVCVLRLTRFVLNKGQLSSSNNSLEHKIARVAEEQMVQFGVGDKEVDKQIALGYFHTNSGNYTEAIVLFTRLLKKNPKVVACYLGRGTALAMSGRLKDAVIDFSHVVALDPNGLEGYRRRGQSLLAMNEQQLAMQDFDTCCRLSPEDSDSHHQRGICFYKMRDFERACGAFELAARLAPEARESWNHLGLTLNQLGRSRDAVVVQETALAIDVTNADTWSNLGLSFKVISRPRIVFSFFFVSNCRSFEGAGRL